MSDWALHIGKVEELAIPKERYHALLCDPPYEYGFMGRDWDKSGVAFTPATWKRLAESLLPGAFGMAFASSRGWHRLACAIEDAGLIIHPTIFCWSFGSGFPKATRIDTQVDAMEGAEREEIGRKNVGKGNGRGPGFGHTGGREGVSVTAPATELAAAWEGHRYGQQAMKPAIEPIIVFQKPYRGKPVDCITATGAGALNIDAGRIETGDNLGGGQNSGHVDQVQEGWDRPWRHDPELRAASAERSRQTTEKAESLGRWPANFCMDEEAARRLDAQTGELSSGAMRAGTRRAAQDTPGSICYGTFGGSATDRDTPGDTGGASRFFHVHDWNHEVEERLFESDTVHYCGKATRAERDAGLAGRNHHPTLKPIALTRWLASLLLPPDRYAPRRLLVPFAGSGSEMIGGMLAGWEDITGIEMGSDHVEIAEARLKFWAARKHRPLKVSKAKEEPADQFNLFAHG